MNRNVQKIIEELIRVGKSELLSFEEQWKSGKKNADLLVTAIILLYFQQVSFDGNKENDKKGVNILFMDPAKIFTVLDMFPADIHKKVSFLEWYLERLAYFYVGNSLKEYEEAGYLLLEEVHQYLNIPEGKRRVLLEKSKKSEKKEQSYIFYRELCESMEKLKRNGVSYTQQYSILFQLGMSTNLIENIRNYQLLQIMNHVNIPIKKKEKHSANCSENEDKFKNSKNTTPSLKENKQEVFESSVSRKKIKEKLEQYIDRFSGENKMILEGDVLLEVEHLLKALYPESKVSFAMKRVHTNNERIKQRMYVNVMKELLSNEEDSHLFLRAKDSLTKELKFDSFFSEYTELVQKIVFAIDTYLYEYLMFTEEEKALLKEDYIQQIAISISELKLHLDYLPFWGEFDSEALETRNV